MNGALEFDELFWLAANQHHIKNRLCQQARTDGADGASRADHHHPPACQVVHPHHLQRLLGGFQRGGDGQAVAGGDGDVAVVGDRHPRVTDDAGERA